MLAILGESIYVYIMDFTPLQQSLSRHPEIIAAYVFGSAVTGKLTPMSDIDVAILLREEPAFDQKLSLLAEVGSDLQKLFRREADVKILNEVQSLPLLHEIFSTAKLIFERDRERHRNFVAHAVIAYLDFQPTYERCLSTYVGRIRHGKT